VEIEKVSQWIYHSFSLTIFFLSWLQDLSYLFPVASNYIILTKNVFLQARKKIFSEDLGETL
jgi:hypothetical protein